MYVGVCSPEDGTCLAQVTIPSLWWPSLTGQTGRKIPKIMASVYYSVRTRSDLDTCDSVASARGHVKVILPPQHVGQVQLTASQSGYQQVS